MSATESSWYYEATVQDSPFENRLFVSPIVVREGRVQTPDLPGLGVEVDEAALVYFQPAPGAAYVI